jgi:hypothetical protein
LRVHEADGSVGGQLLRFEAGHGWSGGS